MLKAQALGAEGAISTRDEAQLTKSGRQAAWDSAREAGGDEGGKKGGGEAGKEAHKATRASYL
jgi:hypothetical protein